MAAYKQQAREELHKISKLWSILKTPSALYVKAIFILRKAARFEKIRVFSDE